MAHASDEPPPPDRRRAGSSGSASPRPTRAPVALAVFARPDLTARVLDAVRAANPARVLVFADAARPGVPGETERCAAVRELVEAGPWDCEVETAFADVHLGQRERIRSGLDWVFSRTEEAIVLEDDCLPDPTFFAFCDELLERYRDDPRVMAISGNDFEHRPTPPATSYRFSRFGLVWGWAGWRRAWTLHDDAMASWPVLRGAGWTAEVFDGDPHAAAYWAHLFEESHAGRGSWDYAWAFTCLRLGGLVAHPTRNLVTNLGFRSDATDPTVAEGHRSPFAGVPVDPMPFPLVHPAEVARDAESDAFLEDVMFSGNLARAFARLRDLRRRRDAVA